MALSSLPETEKGIDRTEAVDTWVSGIIDAAIGVSSLKFPLGADDATLEAWFKSVPRALASELFALTSANILLTT